MSILVASQEHFNQLGIKKQDDNIMAVHCNCSCACANCGTCGCTGYCDIGNCRCRGNVSVENRCFNIDALEEFFAF